MKSPTAGKLSPIFLSASTLLLCLPATLGYTSSTTSDRPFVHHIGMVEEAIHPVPLNKVVGEPAEHLGAVTLPPKEGRIKRTKDNVRQQPQQQATIYNLGIGKNPPVHGKPFSSSVNEHIDITEYTQYWVEHEATREYPSPIREIPRLAPQIESSSLSSSTTTKSGPTKRHQPVSTVQPKRRTQDALHIHSCPLPTSKKGGEKILMTVPSMHRTSNVKLDMNTVWVEMMLHDEQMKTKMTISPTITTPQLSFMPLL